MMGKQEPKCVCRDTWNHHGMYTGKAFSPACKVHNPQVDKWKSIQSTPLEDIAKLHEDFPAMYSPYAWVDAMRARMEEYQREGWIEPKEDELGVRVFENRIDAKVPNLTFLKPAATPRRRLRPTFAPQDTVGHDEVLYAMARWIVDHCELVGFDAVGAVTTSYIAGFTRDSEEAVVRIGTMLHVYPRAPREIGPWVSRDELGRIQLNIISHFTMGEFRRECRPMHELLPIFFRNAILDALEHEVDESIEVDGVRTFDPHPGGNPNARRRLPPFRSVDARDGYNPNIEVTQESPR